MSTRWRSTAIIMTHLQLLWYMMAKTTDTTFTKVLLSQLHAYVWLELDNIKVRKGNGQQIC